MMAYQDRNNYQNPYNIQQQQRVRTQNEEPVNYQPQIQQNQF